MWQCDPCPSSGREWCFSSSGQNWGPVLFILVPPAPGPTQRALDPHVTSLPPRGLSSRLWSVIGSRGLAWGRRGGSWARDWGPFHRPPGRDVPSVCPRPRVGSERAARCRPRPSLARTRSSPAHTAGFPLTPARAPRLRERLQQRPGPGPQTLAATCLWLPHAGTGPGHGSPGTVSSSSGHGLPLPPPTGPAGLCRPPRDACLSLSAVPGGRADSGCCGAGVGPPHSEAGRSHSSPGPPSPRLGHCGPRLSVPHTGQ